MLKSIEGNLIIIANPPYGKIGANITEAIKDSINYICYVNLLPANDYKRSNKKDLYNYQSDMININNGFKGDAAVTTHLAKIYKSKVNEMTYDEFERSNFIDRSLDKYFAENIKRNHYAIDVALCGYNMHEYIVEKSVLFGMRDVNHGGMPKKKNCTTYKWNVEESINYQYLLDNHWSKSLHFTGGLTFSAIEFNTEQEKDNFISIMYSRDGFRLFSKIFTAVNCDSTIHLGKVLPKVDWTRSWTVEELLADYGYTETEIQEVMDDLKNFKGMDD